MEYFDNTAVVLPFVADGKAAISTTLSWDSEVAPALRGNEGRGGFRALPRPKLEFTAHVATILQTSLLRASLQAAFDRQAAGGGSGRVAVPWQARGCWLAADASTGANSVVLEPTPWPWRNGDGWIAFPDLTAAASSLGWQYGRVTGMDDTFQLGLDAPLTDDLYVGSVIYPLFVGRLDVPERASFITDARLRQPLTITGDRQFIDINCPVVCGGAPIPAATPLDVWHGVHPKPDPLQSNFPVAAPDGYVNQAACICFARVSGGVVTEVYGGILTVAAHDAVVALAAGATQWYAVEYWGYRGSRIDYPKPGPRPWISSSDNFRIYPFMPP